MCDYSLYAIRNRLAEEGEELVLYRFPSGTLGFASAGELARMEQTEKNPTGFWAGFKEWMAGKRACTPGAVCIPPGARLLLTDVPVGVRCRLAIGSSEVVTFAEMSNRVNTHRDAIVLNDGTSVLLQLLPQGVRAVVLRLSPDTTVEFHGIEQLDAV